MGNVVDLKPVSLAENLEFIQDMARYRESILDEKSIRKKYRVGAEVWEKLGDDDELIRAIEAESTRRIRDGSCKRERAQQLVTAAPAVLGNIMSDSSQSARHRIDSAKVLNDFAANSPENNAPDANRFIISINISGDGPEHILHFDKSRTIDPNDSGSDVDSRAVIAAIAAKKTTENDSGCESI